MKKYLILYYSWTGNSQFLAERIAEKLGGDVQRISPSLNTVMILSFLSSLNLGVRTNISSKLISKYENVIVIGPLWGGRLIAPLRSILRKGVEARKRLHFAISCSVPDEEKDNPFGYGRSIQVAKKIGGEYLKTTTAFPNALVKKEMISTGIEPPEKITLSEENFTGEIAERLDDFVNRIGQSTIKVQI